MSKTTHHPYDVEDMEYDRSVCRDCGCVLIFGDEGDLCPDCRMLRYVEGHWLNQ